jgi:hypothetical protein
VPLRGKLAVFRDGGKGGGMGGRPVTFSLEMPNAMFSRNVERLFTLAEEIPLEYANLLELVSEENTLERAPVGFKLSFAIAILEMLTVGVISLGVISVVLERCGGIGRGFRVILV